ncbi:hypothetical protein PTE30175_03085 [Pandoraea terrae]|uniref:Uncharacterized protein n=1 Tax=Pandoraea terrae TaxID=1537710 RepID=A0A5E4WBM9_9BURK|nr:hypothetical protein [Pandoraea terrae]VVE21553.1 hypothetical protein PTE30175_03085 [Pandoraea terrae]
MHAMHTGFVVCPACLARFPVAATTPDIEHMRQYLASDARVRCPTCDTTFACNKALSSVELEPVQDGVTLKPTPERSLDGMDNH